MKKYYFILAILAGPFVFAHRQIQVAAALAKKGQSARCCREMNGGLAWLQ